MHRRAFHMNDKREMNIDEYGYDLFYKELFPEDKFGVEVDLGIVKNPDGFDFLLTNLGFTNLREDKHQEQTTLHLNFDEAKALRDYLTREIEKQDKENKKEN